MPARVVVHKSSGFLPDERDGFTQAIAAERVEYCDLLSLRPTFTRLFRLGVYSPLRGTLLMPDDTTHVLYTRGSVPFFAEYPGMYVPRPLDIRYEHAEQSTQFLAREVLALTKMNWNNTQFDGSEPITLRAARQVGFILKYVQGSDPIHPRYSFYMRPGAAIANPSVGSAANQQAQVTRTSLLAKRVLLASMPLSRVHHDR